MYAFTLERPATLADAAKLAAAGAKALAGGQTLLASMKLRLSAPEQLVDLGGIKELAGIKREGNAFVIGAMTRHADVAANAELKAALPGAGRPGRAHRRPPGARHGHAGRLGGQQRPGRLLPRARCWAWAPPSSPRSARSRPTISSRACSPRRWKTAN